MSPGCRPGRVQPGDCPGRGWSRPQTAPKHRRQGGSAFTAGLRPVVHVHRGCTPTRRPTSSRYAAPARPVRGRPWKSRRCTPTARQARTPSAIRPWTPATSGSTARQGDTRRDRGNGPHSREIPASGPFSQVVAGVVWQVLGSNQRRLSRRSYSTLLLPESYAAELRVCVPRCVSGCRRPLCVRAPWVPGAPQATDKDANATDGACGSGYADRLPSS